MRVFEDAAPRAKPTRLGSPYLPDMPEMPAPASAPDPGAALPPLAGAGVDRPTPTPGRAGVAGVAEEGAAAAAGEVVLVLADGADVDAAVTACCEPTGAHTHTQHNNTQRTVCDHRS